MDGSVCGTGTSCQRWFVGDARAFRLVAAMVGALALQPALASAQGAAAGTRSTYLDPSPRAAGMGGVSSAVFWWDVPNEWSNPSLLGYGNGLGYRWSRKTLAHGLAGDAVFRAHRFNYGWGGTGFVAGRLTLEYGRIDLTDASGTPVGSHTPSDRTDAIGCGISIARLFRTIATLRGTNAPAITRRVDVAFGFVRKPIDIDLAPSTYGGQASTRANDVGLLIRVSPMVEGEEGGPFLDLAYGFAALNYNDARVAFVDEDKVDYIERHYRNGFAARFGISASRGLERRFGRLIGRGMQPLVSLGLAADFSHSEIGPAASNAHDANHVGLEIQLVNALALRVGHVTDKAEDINGTSWGLGIGVPLGTVASVRYDFARVPEPVVEDRRSHHGLTLSIDPLAIARR